MPRRLRVAHGHHGGGDPPERAMDGDTDRGLDRPETAAPKSAAIHTTRARAWNIRSDPPRHIEDALPSDHPNPGHDQSGGIVTST